MTSAITAATGTILAAVRAATPDQQVTLATGDGAAFTGHATVTGGLVHLVDAAGTEWTVRADHVVAVGVKPETDEKPARASKSAKAATT